MEAQSSLHIAMYPWLGLGHIIPFLQLSNKLAKKCHRISFFIPTKTQSKIQHLNRFPHLISFIPIAVPHVDGLPLGAETTSDVSSSSMPLIVTAMDETEHDIELLLHKLKPHIVVYDFAYWIPKLARKIGIKTVVFSVASPVMISYLTGREQGGQKASSLFENILLQPPHGFPDLSIKLHRHETHRFVKESSTLSGSNQLSMSDRFYISLTECDAYVSKGSREIEGPFIEFVENYYGKSMMLAGPIIPEPPINSFSLEEKWIRFLGAFEAASVIYCAFGGDCILTKDQFQELLLGFELSGLPFLVALRPPLGTETIEEALPDGFEGRVGGRGVVHGGWIQQLLILQHPSVGCFVTHCGYGSMMEGLVMSNCQLVMIPNSSDQFFIARLIGNRLKAGVEVERDEEDGLFSREGVRKAIKTVMEESYSEVGKEIRANRTKLRELLLKKDIESSYVDDLNQKLQALVLS